jgi:hypothetical protein
MSSNLAARVLDSSLSESSSPPKADFLRAVGFGFDFAGPGFFDRLSPKASGLLMVKSCEIDQYVDKLKFDWNLAVTLILDRGARAQSLGSTSSSLQVTDLANV